MTDDRTKAISNSEHVRNSEAPDLKPPSSTELRGRRWVLPPNVKDVTAQHRGKLFAIVGVPVPKLPEDEET